MSDWRRVEEIVHETLERSPSDRLAYVREACAGDESLRMEVESLLANQSRADALGSGLGIRDSGLGVSTEELIGKRIGVYRIDSLLGAGGMGEVYRARDTNLGREVALKILPGTFVHDADRRARFEREARMLASLNHPHIGGIYGVEESDGTPALVLELVEGLTLADRLAKGPIPLNESLRIANQITDALDAAHEKGIVHRDLKPANIKITSDGVVKVLDFGLAKMFAGNASGLDLTQSPTVTVSGTREGAILGTAAYMSPEQARGQPVDKRADIWAFGCVLYEMLTGRMAFPGRTVSDVIAAILEREPDWSALPAATPLAVRDLLRCCIEKDPKRRLRDIGDARRELDEPRGHTQGDARRPTWSSWRHAAMIALSVVAVGSLAAVALLLLQGTTETTPAVIRTTVNLRAGEELDTQPSMLPLALSADGRRLAYVARRDGRDELYVRDLGAFEAKLLPGTDGARYPFFSPDGQSVAFFAFGKLKTVSILSGSPVPVCDAAATSGAGTWGSQGIIVFDAGRSGLMQVKASGGSPQRITSKDLTIDARNLSWPHFLPDGRTLLVTVANGDSAEAGDSHIAVLSLDTGEWTSIGRGLQAQYVRSGHIVFHAAHVREGEVQALQFDLSNLTVHGSPVSVLDGVFRSEASGGAYFAAASSGALIFARGGHARSLARVDRAGRRTSITDERRGFRFPAFSPDGDRVAVTIDPRPSQIWIYDVLRRSGFALATEGHNLVPVWARDGTRVFYASRTDIYSRSADGATPAQRFVDMELSQYPLAWSRDGVLVFAHQHPVNRSDLWVMSSSGDRRALLSTPAHEPHAKLSPDDRWIAYSSDESGAREIQVRPFPNVNDGKWVVSINGGVAPVWSPNGRELFYMSGTTMMSVAVDSRGGAFRSAAPTALFSGPFETGSPNFDVSPDGQSFVMVEADPDAKPTQINVVLNWSRELTRLVSPAEATITK
jgi:eukaryotic-like serine/threonine-protein kinase